MKNDETERVKKPSLDLARLARPSLIRDYIVIPLFALGLFIVMALWNTDDMIQVRRFFSFSDGFMRDSVLGTMLLGLNCGLLGTLLVARRMAMLADTLSHAVLPGI